MFNKVSNLKIYKTNKQKKALINYLILVILWKKSNTRQSHLFHEETDMTDLKYIFHIFWLYADTF